MCFREYHKGRPLHRHPGHYTPSLSPTSLSQRPQVHAGNDPKHTSRHAKQWIEENGVNWWRTLAESPDMNPIENLWHELKEYIRRGQAEDQEWTHPRDMWLLGHRGCHQVQKVHWALEESTSQSHRAGWGCYWLLATFLLFSTGFSLFFVLYWLFYNYKYEHTIIKHKQVGRVVLAGLSMHGEAAQNNMVFNKKR